jgi:hypothetical protein
MPDVGFTINKISGTDGSVRMPDVGVLVGWFSMWTLTKKKPTDSTYVLRATFGHVNPTLWNQDYPKVFTVKLTKDKFYQICGAENAVLNDKSIEVENVTLCPPEGSSPQ